MANVSMGPQANVDPPTASSVALKALGLHHLSKAHTQVATPSSVNEQPPLTEQQQQFALEQGLKKLELAVAKKEKEAGAESKCNLIANYLGSMTSQQVRALFKSCGDIVRCRVVMDSDTGKSRGYGFVKFSDPEGAKLAIERFNGMEHSYGGVKKRLKVSYARPRSNSRRGANVFVTHLKPGITDDDLKQLFLPYGTIVEHRVLKDRKTGKSRGSGFVRFAFKREALLAIEMLDNQPKDLLVTKNGREVSISVCVRAKIADDPGSPEAAARLAARKSGSPSFGRTSSGGRHDPRHQQAQLQMPTVAPPSMGGYVMAAPHENYYGAAPAVHRHGHPHPHSGHGMPHTGGHGHPHGHRAPSAPAAAAYAPRHHSIPLNWVFGRPASSAPAAPPLPPAAHGGQYWAPVHGDAMVTLSSGSRPSPGWNGAQLLAPGSRPHSHAGSSSPHHHAQYAAPVQVHYGRAPHAASPAAPAAAPHHHSGYAAPSDPVHMPAGYPPAMHYSEPPMPSGPTAGWHGHGHGHGLNPASTPYTMGSVPVPTDRGASAPVLHLAAPATAAASSLTPAPASEPEYSAAAAVVSAQLLSLDATFSLMHK